MIVRTRHTFTEEDLRAIAKIQGCESPLASREEVQNFIQGAVGASLQDALDGLRRAEAREEDT